MVAQAKLSARVPLIGMPALPPSYFDLFARLAACIDVHLFLLNPCQEYWGDIVAERDLARQTVVNDPAALHFETGNPLLASMGKLGRDFIALVQDYAPHLVKQYADPGGDSLLHGLQSDVLHLHPRGTSTCPAAPLRPDDSSVQVHICHSPMREIEVLYDQLLGLFARHPDLQPSDVVVMAPAIDAYAPLIEAVFGAGEGRRSVPFSIADRGLRAHSPLVNACFALVQLPGQPLGRRSRPGAAGGHGHPTSFCLNWRGSGVGPPLVTGDRHTLGHRP